MVASCNCVNCHDSQADEIRKPFECQYDPYDHIETIGKLVRNQKFDLLSISVPIEEGSEVKLVSSRSPSETSISLMWKRLLLQEYLLLTKVTLRLFSIYHLVVELIRGTIEQ